MSRVRRTPSEAEEGEESEGEGTIQVLQPVKDSVEELSKSIQELYNELGNCSCECGSGNINDVLNKISQGLVLLTNQLNDVNDLVNNIVNSDKYKLVEAIQAKLLSNRRELINSAFSSGSERNPALTSIEHAAYMHGVMLVDTFDPGEFTLLLETITEPEKRLELLSKYVWTWLKASSNGGVSVAAGACQDFEVISVDVTTGTISNPNSDGLSWVITYRCNNQELKSSGELLIVRKNYLSHLMSEDEGSGKIIVNVNLGASPIFTAVGESIKKPQKSDTLSI